MTTLRDVEKKPFGNRVALVLLTVVAVAACGGSAQDAPASTTTTYDAVETDATASTTETPIEDEQPTTENAESSDLDVDFAYKACEAGNLFACQFLVEISESGSLDEIFGLSCGGRSENLSDGCALDYSEERKAFFQATRAACSDEDLFACDQLYNLSPEGSADELFGSTCGERSEESFGYCAANSLGVDSVTVNELSFGCLSGSLFACDELFVESEEGSYQEEIARTCGNTTQDSAAKCGFDSSEYYVGYRLETRARAPVEISSRATSCI